MPDTYNENEIVKLKHLNEFARQLTIKLDGGTDPKPIRPITRFTYKRGSSYPTLPINDQTTSLDFTLKISQLTVSSEKHSIPLRIFTPLEVIPQFIDIVASDGSSWTPGNPSFDWQTTGATYNGWMRALFYDAGLVTEPLTVSFTVHFEETLKYAERNLRVNVTIQAD